MKIETVGVIGAGVMGVGLAQNLAQTNHRVVLLDVTEEALERARHELKRNIRFQGFFDKKRATVNVEQTMERIIFSTDYGLLAEVDFVIENATEKWEVKKGIYERIDELCPPDCRFAANTSAIPITRLAGLTARPDKVLGLHFMNPVPLKRTVEMIRGHHTSPETLAIAQSLLESMGKDFILVNDWPGFVSNRVLMLTINEAIFLVQDGVAPAEDIDRIFKSCFEHKMGPLETADLIGLDTILLSLEVLYENFNDGKYRPSPLLRKMVDAGLHGRKSGRGFYNYSHE
jgi:3-hydroxybutyryl-CoA dehydrogenase